MAFFICSKNILHRNFVNLFHSLSLIFQPYYVPRVSFAIVQTIYGNLYRMALAGRSKTSCEPNLQNLYVIYLWTYKRIHAGLCHVTLLMFYMNWIHQWHFNSSVYVIYCQALLKSYVWLWWSFLPFCNFRDGGAYLGNSDNILYMYRSQ